MRTGLYMMGMLLVILTGCVKPYNIPSSASNLNLLVVDGAINPGGTTTITLSRTSNISDSLEKIPENNAQVSIESESGSSFPLNAQGEGIYDVANNGPVSVTDKYRLRISTSGQEYLSDFVEVKQSPNIDSIEWEENDDIYIYVNSHDPSGTSRYYRWEFDETSEYTSVYDSQLDFINGEIVFLEPEQTRYTCYKFFNSTEILLSNTNGLSSDVISHYQITHIRNDYTKIAKRYSILVKQYVLTPDAYHYWETLKANSEQTGNIFDPQPSQLPGNIHNVANALEPVVGFLSASTISEKRIFIKDTDLKVRRESNLVKFCNETVIGRDQTVQYLSDGTKLPAYYLTGGGLAIAPVNCVDCRVQGGVTQKPTYW